MNNVQLKVGDKAPEFELPTNIGRTVSLKNLKGKNVVLYFYPKDSTPGCTLEARDFSANIEKFQEQNCEVIGVSKDSIKSHCSFVDKQGLSILLASDENNDVCEKYGVWVEKNLYVKKYMGIERSTFLIDKSGVIRKIWRSVEVKGHVLEVLHSLQAIKAH
jgi:peroxiredoxin Q/BCP